VSVFRAPVGVRSPGGPRGTLSPMSPALGNFEKALRFGEGRRLKRLQEQAAYIATLEPDFQKLSDEALRGKTVGILGLTFKPMTDDMRDAPSIPLITALHDMGALVRAFDPAGMEQAKMVLPDVTYCDGPYSCVDGADGLVIVTEWEQFCALDSIESSRRWPVLY